MRVLFLGKRDDPRSEQALAKCRARFAAVDAHLGEFGEPLPPPARAWEGDLIISYLSRWIVPAALLDRARYAVNFHPAPPEYPGVGCVNFALYDGAASYGVTCRHMAAVVDSGDIIAVRRFPVRPDDDVESLLRRSYECQFSLFGEIIELLATGRPLPSATERWGAHTYTKARVECVCQGPAGYVR